MLLWCHVFQALCGFFESVRIQEKVTEKQEGKGLFQMGYQGATFLSLAHDEDRRWHGAQPAPYPLGAPTSIQEEQEEHLTPTQRPHLHHMGQEFNALNKEAWRPGFIDKSIPCKKTHTRRSMNTWKAGDLGPSVGSGTDVEVRQVLVPTQPQVLI